MEILRRLRNHATHIGGHMAGSIVTVRRLVKEADLRRVHVYRERFSPRLKTGQAVLLANYACDKIRLIDSAGGVHNYYAPPGEIFDVALIQKHLGAMRIQLSLHAKARAYFSWYKKAA
jgi:hypothetical protein